MLHWWAPSQMAFLRGHGKSLLDAPRGHHLARVPLMGKSRELISEHRGLGIRLLRRDVCPIRTLIAKQDGLGKGDGPPSIKTGSTGPGARYT